MDFPRGHARVEQQHIAAQAGRVCRPPPVPPASHRSQHAHQHNCSLPHLAIGAEQAGAGGARDLVGAVRVGRCSGRQAQGALSSAGGGLTSTPAALRGAAGHMRWLERAACGSSGAPPTGPDECDIAVGRDVHGLGVGGDLAAGAASRELGSGELWLRQRRAGSAKVSLAASLAGCSRWAPRKPSTHRPLHVDSCRGQAAGRGEFFCG